MDEGGGGGGDDDARLALHHEAMENGADDKNCTEIYGGEQNECGALNKEEVSKFLRSSVITGDEGEDTEAIVSISV